MKNEHESESNQDIVGLDMEKGLHVPNYPQRFVRAKGVNKPGPNNNKAMKVNAHEVMSETCHAKK